MTTSASPVRRSRWAALGAAVAVSVGAGGFLTTSASVGSGERAVYVPITPCRLIDTRPAPDTVGTRTSPLGPEETLPVTVRGASGNCTLPADAAGVVMNVAIIAPTASSFLTVFPSDVTRPLAASANWLAGDPPASNAVTTGISADGRVSFYNLSGTAHLAVDIVGYYVDHTHDDRYYTEAESDARYYTEAESDGRYYTEAESDARYVAKSTITFDGSTLVINGNLPSSINECASSGTGTTTGRVSLPLPVGTRITAVRVAVYDGAGPAPYTVWLSRRVVPTSPAPTGIEGTTVVSATGGGQANAVVSQTLIPPTVEVVDPGETFALQISGIQNYANGVCQVAVDVG